MSSHKSVRMTQVDDDNMDSTSRLEERKDEEIRVTGLCIRIKNFFNLRRRRLGKVSPGKFCWKKKKKEHKDSLRPTRTSTTTTSYEQLGSNTTASNTGTATITDIMEYRRRRTELQCEIEGDEKSFSCSPLLSVLLIFRLPFPHNVFLPLLHLHLCSHSHSFPIIISESRQM